MFSIVILVWSSMSAFGGIWLVAGSMGIWPEMKSRFPDRMACE